MANAADIDSMRAGLTQPHRFNAIIWRQNVGHVVDANLEQLKEMTKKLTL
jgi:hypothetical protein